MRSSAPEAIAMFNKWMQESSHLRLMLVIDSPSVSVLVGGEAVSASLEDERFLFKVGDAEFIFLASEAEFESLEPKEANLPAIGISVQDCVCCLSIKVRDLLMRGDNLPNAILLICELSG